MGLPICENCIKKLPEDLQSLVYPYGTFSFFGDCSCCKTGYFETRYNIPVLTEKSEDCLDKIRLFLLNRENELAKDREADILYFETVGEDECASFCPHATRIGIYSTACQTCDFYVRLVDEAHIKCAFAQER